MADEESHTAGNDQAAGSHEEPSAASEEEEEYPGEGMVKSSRVFAGESDTYVDGFWTEKVHAGEYAGEGGFFVLPVGEEDVEYPSVWEEPEDELGEVERPTSGSISTVSSAVEVEETEEERIERLEREELIDSIKKLISDRMNLRKRNVFLNRKLVEHFKKRRMEHVLKEDPKGLELESKYLKRLYVFQNFKENEEEEVMELSSNLNAFRNQTEDLEDELMDTLDKFIQRQKELSLGLVSAKTGKRLSEKMVDRLLRRQIKKCEEKGRLKLKYVKLKNLMEDKEQQLKKMENFGDGLRIMDYEQLKLDNQNYTDKIEEKEEELAKLRVKTNGSIQNLAHVREKAYAIEGDIELMEAKFYDVETEFHLTRERVGKAKKNRDSLREEYVRLKALSGLLTNDTLLKDFEQSIDETGRVKEIRDEMISLIKENKKKQTELESLARVPYSSQ